MWLSENKGKEEAAEGVTEKTTGNKMEEMRKEKKEENVSTAVN